MSLQPFQVVVWVRKTDAFADWQEEIIGLAADGPDESTEYQGVVHFHWGFDSLKEAESVAEVLTVLCPRPELVLLRVSNYDDPDASTTFKDARPAKH